MRVGAFVIILKLHVIVVVVWAPGGYSLRVSWIGMYECRMRRVKMGVEEPERWREEDED